MSTRKPRHSSSRRATATTTTPTRFAALEAALASEERVAPGNGNGAHSLTATERPVVHRVPNPEALQPTLPDPIPDPEISVPEAWGNEDAPTPAPGRGPHWPVRRFRTLRGGCYLVRYIPTQPGAGFNTVHYDGTLRVERAGSNTIASGDLYLHQLRQWSPGRAPSPFRRRRPTEPDPGSGIPIFSRAQYRYYIRVTQIAESPRSRSAFTMRYELYRFTHATNSWTNDGTFDAELSWKTAPAAFPAGADYLTGDVKSSTGAVIGQIEMGWISEFLRSAVLEIDRVNDAEAPHDNGNGKSWETIFRQIGWDLKIIESENDLSEPSGTSWSDAEMHAMMLAKRSQVSLDVEWRYHILCVRNIDSTPRGIMYDSGATDSNKVPREGVGIASHWTIPEAEMWGRCKGLRFGSATAPYFRTAVHEIGHAMGLYHNTADMGIMNTTDMIAASAEPPLQFPDNIKWSHAPDDQKRLRHMPDAWVRPGGTPFGLSYSTAPISADDLIEEAEGLTLDVRSIAPSVPIGAPVRVNFALVNESQWAIPIPASLSIRAGFVRGKVIDPSGTVRTFLPLLRCLEEHELRDLEPGERAEHDLTLLRGPQGPLFPNPGLYRVMVEVEWDVGGTTVGAVGETSVMVTPAESEEHAAAALAILSTPDAHLTLALGGDHLTSGVAAVQGALAVDVLRPHYAVTEARRLSQRFLDRPADPAAAAALLDEPTVQLTEAELRRLLQAVRAVVRGSANDGSTADAGNGGGAARAAVRELVDVLRTKADGLTLTPATQELLTDRAISGTRSRRSGATSRRGESSAG